MNDGTDNHNEPSKEAPLRPWIEPELEARLTALVLGEASDFEREELEREISARPELGAYRNRLEAMHSLLSEVGKGEATENDEEWKLSGERRATLLETIGGPALKEAPAETRQSQAATVGEAPKRYWVAPILKIAASLMVATGLALFGFFRFSESTMPEAAMAAEESGPPSDHYFYAATSSDNEVSTVYAARASDVMSVTGVEEMQRDYRIERAKALDVTQLSVIPEARTSTPMPNKPDEGNVHSLFGQQRKPSAPMPEQKVDDLMVLSSIDDLQDEVEAKGNISVSAGGEIAVLGKGVELSNRSDLIASAGSGGAVRIGGGFELQDPSPEKAESAVWQDADTSGVSGMGGLIEMDSNGIFTSGTIEASASSGDGGEIVVGDGVVGNITLGRQVGDITPSEVPKLASGYVTRLQERVKKADAADFDEAQHEWLNYPGQEGNAKRDTDQIQWSNDQASSGAFAGGSIIAGKNVGTSGGGSLNLISGWVDQNDNAVAEILALTPQVVGGGSVEAESEELLERRQKQFAGIGHGGSSIGLDFINPRSEGEQSNAPNVAGHGQVAPITAGSMVMPLDEAEMPLGMVGSRFGDLTVSLSAVPEVVSFDGFINHGYPGLASVPNGLDETAAAEEAFSTFSLHVSDVSFQLAQASLAKGEWPDRERIRIEEFVNAFDYGDPMPGQDDKVACRVEQVAHPFFQQRNLLRVSLRTAEAGRSANTPLRLTLLLDNSGSMERSDRQETVKRAFATLASQLQENDQVSLISFARQPRLVADAIAGPEANALVETVSTLPSEGGTNLEAALQLATEKAKEHQLEGAQNRIVLLTDGAANLGDADPENLSRLIESLRESGIAFDAAGIGADGLNDEILEALTRKGDGRYYLLDQPEDAEDGFAKQIAGALRPAAKNVKVQVEFNPDRVGRYKLLGFEKHRLEKEDFRDDKVDAAEMAAAEAGVAVYQVEPMPEGEGNLGAISVRFRDLDSGEMIEKRWPIPYLPSAPSAGQAGDSMQLATVAAQFAAKLKGGPLGDVVDLGELARLAGALPDRLQNLERVQQLREMIEQARSLEGNG